MRRSGRSPEQPLGHSENLASALIRGPEVSPLPRPIVRMLGVILVKHVCQILASLAADMTPIVRRMPRNFRHGQSFTSLGVKWCRD